MPNNSVKISGTSPIDNSKAVYGVYTDKACKNKVGETQSALTVQVR